MSMATVMSQMPDVWRRVLAEHVPDHARRCRACCSPTGVQASWPCQTFKVADEARALSEGYLPVPSAPAPRDPASGSHRPYDRWSDSWAPEPMTSGSRTDDPLTASSTGREAWSSGSWASDPWADRGAELRPREIADWPLEPRDGDRWERDRRDAWSYGSSFRPGDSWSR